MKGRREAVHGDKEVHMSDTTRRYRDVFDRETAGVAWRSPDGREFLVCGTPNGYALRSPSAWESDEAVEFEADVQGNVFFEGEAVGWKIPRQVLSRAGVGD